MSAELIFTHAATGAVLRINRACWLEHHYNYATFAPGQTHDLLVAFDDLGTLVAVDDQRQHNSGYGSAATEKLPNGRLVVAIVILADTVSIPYPFEFEWTSSNGFAM